MKEEEPTQFNQNKIWRLCKTFVLLVVFIPVCYSLTIFYVLKQKFVDFVNFILFRSEKVKIGSKNQTIVINGGKMQKSLLMCKWFGQAGYRVIVIESPRYWACSTRFSKYCTKFYTVTDCRQDPEKYKSEIIDICKKENANIWFPVCAPASEQLDSEIADILSKKSGVKSMCCPHSMMDDMQDKHKFGEFVEQLGLPSLQTYKVSSDEEVLKINESLKNQESVYVLKNIQFDPAHRLDLFKLPSKEGELKQYLKKIRKDGNPITKEEPWQIQRFIVGDEYTTCSIIQNGNIQIYADSISSPSQFDWLCIHNPKIKKWIQDFGKKSKISGIFTIDFMIETSTGEAFAIENNPRLGSNLATFMKNSRMGDSILDQSTKTVYPVLDVSTYNIYNDWFRLVWPEYYGYKEDLDLYAPQRLFNFVYSVLFKYDMILDGDDIMPFIALGYFQTLTLLQSNFSKGYDWKKVDFQIGKVVEVGGD